MRIEGKFLVFDFHELAFSARTSGILQYFFDETGEELDSFESRKRAFQVEIPDTAKYFFRRYFTNSGYPNHQLYELPTLQVVATVKKDGVSVKTELPTTMTEALWSEFYK